MDGDIVIIHHSADAVADHIRKEFPDAPLQVFYNETDADKALENAEVVLSLGRWLTPEHLARMPKLKWFQCMITGTDHLAGPLGGRDDILVTNARGIHGRQMTEMAVFHMMAVNRQAVKLVHQKDAHHWERILMKVLDRKTAVIVGVGAISEQTARVLKAFDMRVIGVSGTPRDLPNFDEIRPRSELVQTAAEADYLIILAPYTPQNDKMINADVFNAMKKTAIMVNIARGRVVDEQALVAALQSGEIAGAGLDVTEVQPLPKSSPLWDMENVFITAQSAGQSEHIVNDSAKTFVMPNMRAYLAGNLDEMVNIVKL